ncbi:SH3 domain-containing protein [Alphaproteobacteria bacterium]|nr:SH3 domain-containing protein [Alphaproteobacteria bacterium]
MFKILLIYLFFLFFIFTKNIQSKNLGSVTGYDIPRFVSLKSNEINLRIGSSTNYPILLQYTIKDMPIEIIEEYDVWRKTKDIEGNEGWIHKNLLKGDRFGLIIKKNKKSAIIYSKPSGLSIGEIGSLNIVKIKSCLIDWCKINYKKNSGWISKKNLWGVYNDELINVPFYQFILNKIWQINFNFINKNIN